MTTPALPDTATLRDLIGRHVLYHGQEWIVIDLLPEEGPDLVLERPGERVVQANQHGDGHRRVAPLLNLPVGDGHGRTSPEFLALTVLEST